MLRVLTGVQQLGYEFSLYASIGRSRECPSAIQLAISNTFAEFQLKQYIPCSRGRGLLLPPIHEGPRTCTKCNEQERERREARDAQHGIVSLLSVTQRAL